MKKALFCLIILLPLIAFAQVTEEWVARYDGPGNDGDWACAIALDDSGNVYVTGYSYGSGTDLDYATVKYSSSGVQQWVARYDGPASGEDEAKAMAIDGAGNVYVTGYSYGSGTMSDYATVKYNSSGVQQWVARYDGPASGHDWATAMAVDADGNVYVTGVSKGSETSWDYATVRYNSSGVEQWVARYDGPASGGDEANAMAIDGAGNVYVTGYSYGSGTHFDYATVKYSSSGVEQWVARYDGDDDYARAMAIDESGNVYVTGESRGSGTENDYATVKYSSSGDQQWVARYDGPASGYDWARAIAVDDAGNVYVTGHSRGSGTENDYATVKYSSSGDQQWVARYDGPGSENDVARAIALDGSGNVYVTGESEGDYVTIKYNPEGVEEWVARYNGPGNGGDYARSIAVDAGNVYVTGYSDGGEYNYDYATIKYSQGPGITEASVDAPEYLLEVTQLTPQPTIAYTLPSSSSISLKLFDVTGQLVKTLVTGSQPAGTHTVRWPVTHPKTPSGVYFVRLETSNRSATAKLVVAR